MQWVWQQLRDRNRNLAIAAVAGYLAIVALAFVYFYPILAGITITNDARMQRMWLNPGWV